MDYELKNSRSLAKFREENISLSLQKIRSLSLPQIVARYVLCGRLYI